MLTWGSGTIGATGQINALNSVIGLLGFGFVGSVAVDNVNDTILVSIGGRVLVGSQTVGFTAVRAGSTAWDADFTDLVDPVLDLGYIIPPDAPPLPWNNLNRLSVTFTNALEKAGGGMLSADDFDISGVNQADYNALVIGFSYNAATRTATFTFSQPIEADTLTVHIDGSDVQDAAGHVQLGQYDFQFDVLPGDVNGDFNVDAADIDLLAQANNGPYHPLLDLNNDGVVSYDVGLPGTVTSDSDLLIRTILQTEYGDLNLDGQVFLSDLITFATNYRKPGQFGWAGGNLDGVRLGELSRARTCSFRT